MKRRARTQIYQDATYQWRWRLLSNGRIMADSGEGYSSKAHAERARDRLFDYIKKGQVTVG